MGILSKIYICPEMDCSNAEEGKKGQICPKCSTEYQEITSFQANNLRAFKNQIKNEKLKRKEKEMKKMESKNALFDDEDVNNNLKMDNLVNEDIYINWEELEAELDDNSQAKLIVGLKAIFEQNKLIIRQNELIYRELKLINEKK